MKPQILDKSKKRKFIEKMSYLGIQKIPYLLIQTGQDKIRAYSGSFSNNELYKLWEILRIENIGLCIAKQAGDVFRISLDGLHVLKGQISKNIINVDENQEKNWFLGQDIFLNNNQADEIEGFVALKDNENDFIGTGKIFADKTKVSSFLPKSRRIKTWLSA